MTIGHEMIFASAGSGKTHALTTRFIRLLALDVPPERIVALTFTRKAAGEFFSEIVNRLAGAAVSEDGAARLAADVGRRSLGREDFLRLLETMLQSMHRLNLGTLDGFFARIVHAFPLELGLSGVPEVLDERSAAEELRRVLGRLMAPRGGLGEEQQALIDAFRLATFGTEDKAVTERLDGFIERNLTLFRAAPALEAWGAVNRIWPDGFPWGDPEADPSPAADVLREWACGAGLKEKPLARWLAFIDAAVAWAPGGPMPRELSFVLEKALEAWGDVEKGCAELKFYNSPQRLTREACEALRLLVRRVIARELRRRVAVTQGIGRVLRAFDQLYDAEVRRAGRLTFSDLQQLLVPDVTGVRFSSGDGEDDTRLQLDYRMDARFDHWMFDEFQDTSFPQWQILENLVDEVMQDDSGRRSFFYVGDIKQAIYTWREGDPRLFSYVADRYKSLPHEGVVPRELNDSWRSGPAVIEMVNRVCGDRPVIGELFPEAAPEWIKWWRTHNSARPERRGQAALLLADDEAGRWETTLRVLQAIDPIGRGLTCAVLVRTNSTGAQLADYLRREGQLPAVAEADLHIGTDNPVATALAALLRSAAHPGDTLARGHVIMSPLQQFLLRDGDDHPEAVTRRVLAAVQTKGFEAWFESWAARMEEVLAEDDDFSRLRLRQLVMSGQAFDATGSRDIDAFLRFLEAHTVREPEGAGVVRVMTIHKSKGLGFDVVVLPDLQGQKLAQRRSGPAVRKGADRAIDWVLEYPGELVAAHDPVLRDYLREAVAENCYEQLSLLYVALTRAKHATYAVVEPPGKSVSLNFPRLLTETLGDAEMDVQVGTTTLRGAWSFGDEEWFAAQPRVADAAERESLLPVVESEPSRQTFAPLRPSGEKAARLDASSLFSGTGGAAVEFGRTVHALLAEVEGAVDEGDVARYHAEWTRRGVDAEACAEALGCLTAQSLAQVWAAPSARVEVWRERPFELAIDGAWITGVLDRVVVQLGADGRPHSAVVYDFKTDRLSGASEVSSAAARHAPQLRIYKTAVSRLAGLSPQDVRLAVVFTGAQACVGVD